jgi:hypothetical protein
MRVLLLQLLLRAMRFARAKQITQFADGEFLPALVGILKDHVDIVGT